MASSRHPARKKTPEGYLRSPKSASSNLVVVRSHKKNVGSKQVNTGGAGSLFCGVGEGKNVRVGSLSLSGKCVAPGVREMYGCA